MRSDRKRFSSNTGVDDRIAACWYGADGFRLDLNVTDASTHGLAMYWLDWGTTVRTQRVDLIDMASATVLDTRTLSGFHDGTYLLWDVSGHLTVRITRLGAFDTVLSGIFFQTPSGSSMLARQTASATALGSPASGGAAVSGRVEPQAPSSVEGGEAPAEPLSAGLRAPARGVSAAPEARAHRQAQGLAAPSHPSPVQLSSPVGAPGGLSLLSSGELSYDPNGNLTGDSSWTFAYDRENRLTLASNSTIRVDYVYDAFGRLIERRSSGASASTNRMYYAGWQLIAEYDGGGNLDRKYVYGPGIDEPVLMASGGTNYFYHADGLGSVTEITDSTGATLETYTYDVYGAPTIRDGSGATIAASAIGNRLMFTGRERDPDTTLYNYRYRYYSPGLGRFVQPDPIGLAGGALDLYTYVRNRPSGWTDAFGLTWIGSISGEAWLIFGEEDTWGTVPNPTWITQVQGGLYLGAGILLGAAGFLGAPASGGITLIIVPPAGTLIAGGLAQLITGNEVVNPGMAFVPTQYNFFTPSLWGGGPGGGSDPCP